MTHKVLDHSTQKIIYRSAVGPQRSSTHNHRLAAHGGDASTSSNSSEDKISSGSPVQPSQGYSLKQKTPTVIIRSMRIHLDPSLCQPFDPEDLIGRTFLLACEENGERHWAKVTRKVVEIFDQENGHRKENISFLLDKWKS